VTLFLLVFFTIYGGAHAYVFSRIKAAFPLLSTLQQAGLVLLMIFMILAPVLVRVSEHYGHESAACVLSYIGYLWMGVLFLFFVMSVFFDIYRLLLYIAGLILQADLSFLLPRPVYALVVPLALSVALNAYGFYEARTIRTGVVTIHTSKIPREIGRLRIAQLSDVHIGMIVREERLRRILDAVRKAEPDLLVSTGDLLDGQIDNLMSSADLLRQIRPRYGKYAVMGNHEYFAGIVKALDFHERAGFVVLRGDALTLANLISIAGMDDATGARFGAYRPAEEKTLMAKLPKDTFTLLLKHRPVVEPDSEGHFDLQLAGHTHKGQIYPFVWLTGLVFPYHSGYHDLAKGSRLYINPGAGTWGPPVRLLAPPEITVIDLVYKD
jgi:hypothetical protein